MPSKQAHRLRFFRSSKNLRATARDDVSALIRYQDIHASVRSSVTTCSTDSSISLPSTGHSSISAEWDPLRQHPPLATALAPTWTQSYHALTACDNPTTPLPHPKSVRAARSARNMKARNVWAYQDDCDSGLCIYDQFDFGFESSSSSGDDMSSSDASPVCDRFETDSDSETSQTAPPNNTEWGSRTAPVAVTPRPQDPVTNNVDHFLMKGGWKRRGIVFAVHENRQTQPYFDVF